MTNSNKGSGDTPSLSTNAKWFEKQSCLPEVSIAKLSKFLTSLHPSEFYGKITDSHVVCMVQNTKLKYKLLFCIKPQPRLCISTQIYEYMYIKATLTK